MVTVPAAFDRQELMLADEGTMLKVTGVPSWAFALVFAWSSELERLEAPAARAPISTRALSATIESARRLMPLNKRENEICMCLGPFLFSFFENYVYMCLWTSASSKASV
jgi:hypothetical protein